MSENALSRAGDEDGTRLSWLERNYPTKLLAAFTNRRATGLR
jgi:hypothetical protein